VLNLRDAPSKHSPNIIALAPRTRHCGDAVLCKLLSQQNRCNHERFPPLQGYPRRGARSGSQAPAALPAGPARGSPVPAASRHPAPARGGPRQPRGQLTQNPTHPRPRSWLLARSPPRPLPAPCDAAGASLGECGLPGGLCGARGTLPRCRAALQEGFLPSCHTGDEWWVRPSSVGTSTPQEAPSFAWRTNAPAHREPPERNRSASCRTATGRRCGSG
jgi:hypothetical protein